MPAKNTVKRYAESGYYHLYNRGVAKNPIFLNEQDYGVFLHYLKEYLSPPKPITPEEFALKKIPYLLRNYHQEIEMISFCLMPNHFHFLLKQSKERSITFFMQSLATRYTQYFNRNHDRVGHLFQGVYKGILIRNEEYLWWVSRYLHRNPVEILNESENLESYPYSSYSHFLGKNKIEWLKPEVVLESIKNYREFVENSEEKTKLSTERLTELTLE